MKTAEGIRPGSQVRPNGMQELEEWAGTSEEEGLRMGPEQPDGTGGEGVGSRVSPREGTGSADHWPIRQ